jgi:hypothetical protein
LTAIPDTVNGAIILSVFDFIACFFVLWFISFFIKGLSFICQKIEAKKEAK